MKSLLFLFLASMIALGAKTKIACVGDSITFGAGIPDRAKNSYPSQLGALLGEDYEVRNFGVSGRTMLSKGDNPYTNEKAFRKSLKFSPDIVIIKLGTNDSKPGNWKFADEFEADTKALIKSYRELDSKPRIILCKPVPAFKVKWGINDETIKGQISKTLERVAVSEKVEIIDLHIALRGMGEHFPDKIHPNTAGAGVMARHIYRYLSMPRVNFSSDDNGKVDEFFGFRVVSFNDEKQGLRIKIVSPKKAAKGKPWVWRARFWGHQPQLDIQLLELGFHVVYCDVANLFGSPEAVKKWDACYKKTRALGLHKKVLLEGMSRGGLIIHNWAVSHTDKVAGIISDNGVLDFKSWPAGMGTGKGSPATWELCKKAYGFKSDDEARAYRSNPVDTLAQLTAAEIPLMYLIAGKDLIVPSAENGGLAAKRMAGYNYLQVLHKPNAGHHPHSLENPEPMTRFALQCYGFIPQLN